MARWTPTKDWAGADVYIIGGGPSLAGFNFEVLRGRRVIGCNVAFMLGPSLCPLCYFSDEKWFLRSSLDGLPVHLQLHKYAKAGGIVVTNNRTLAQHNLPWLRCVERGRDGLDVDTTVAFNGNTGCSAINLALQMGARRVFLLGMDCKVYRQDQPNWHGKHFRLPGAGVHEKFRAGFFKIAQQLPHKFPGCEIINLGPDSALTCFPVWSAKEHFANATCN